MGCTDKNPLVREGTSLLTRAQAALSPSFARPDERSAADLLLFLRRYAAYLNYYNSANVLEEDWLPLMKGDVSVTLATIMALDIRKCSDYKKLIYKKIKNGDDAEAIKLFKYLFDLVFSLPVIIAEQYNLLPPEFEYRKEMEMMIKLKILGPVVNLKNLYDVFTADNLIDTAAKIDSNAPIPVTSSAAFVLSKLGTGWTLPAVVASLTVPALPGPKQKIVYIINHNFFNAQVEGLLMAASTVSQKAATLFDTTIKNYPSHTPHYALILAFVKLFSHAQDELNSYTKRHLDFYYKEALQLRNKQAEEDAVHLLFDLQKTIPKHLLLKGTLFKGGKDNITGKELSYALAEDVVLNKAVVEKLQAIRVIKGAKKIVAAFPVATSEDGQGAKLVSPDKSWATFGNPATGKSAAAGFAVASNVLFLNEGTRTVTVNVTFAAGTTTFAEPSSLPHTGFFTGKLTTDKGWLDVDLQVAGNTSGNMLRFSFTLHPTDPAVKPYAEKVHKENIETELPVLKVYLNQDSPYSYPYRLLTRDRVRSVTININVVGVKDLMLSNNTSSIDASKPFKPFGEFPDQGASFYIGSKEIFQKHITELSFDFGNNISHVRDVNYLHNGTWDTSHRLTDNTETLALAGNVFPPAAIDFSKNEVLAATTIEGFIKLSLNSPDYSMDHYLDLVKGQIDNTSIKKTSNDPVTYAITSGEIAMPPALVLSGFSINYKASATISLNTTATDKNSRFLHLTPFGYYEVDYDATTPSKKQTLVAEMPNDGELFIGLNNTEPEEVVNILFQVAEGSSNPLKDVEEVHWLYLAASNEWMELESTHLIDRTNNFTQSGIVTITLPLNISNQCTALQKGLYWLKAAVQQNPDAVCKMILVQAQAAQVKLVQDEAQGIAFNLTLPAGTVSKLVTTDAAVKTITQPFDSFGGRIKETDEHFYVRVSERLRHKQRAIAIWDYEHIILEQFPQISKVKCINHAGFYAGANNTTVFCETYPGHVTIITIPDFRNKSGINPLRPYTPIGTMNNINAYLSKLIPPFVKLHVKAPQFEEIQFEFNVSFHEHLDDGFYRQLLSTEIERFLTPWAYEGSGEISFGGKIIKSAVLNFIEERPYVDFITCFKMHHIIQRSGAVHTEEKRDIEEAIPSTARSLLVSYSNEITKVTHIIQSPADCEC